MFPFMKAALFLTFSIVINSALSIAQSAAKLEWVKGLENIQPFGGYVRIVHMALDPSGNQVIVGIFTEQCDFDPGPARKTLQSKGNFDIFIAKYTPNGVMLFAKSMGDAEANEIRGLDIDAAGNIYLTGDIRYAYDFDPGPGTFYPEVGGNRTMFFAKYDNHGNFIYVKTVFGNGKSPGGTCIEVSSENGNIWVVGETDAGVDFDPGPQVFLSTERGMYIARYNLDGEFLFVRIVRKQSDLGLGNGARAVKAVLSQQAGNEYLYIAGYFSGNVDWYPGAANDYIRGSILNSEDIFMAKYTSAGELWYVTTVGGSGREILTDFSLDNSNNMLIAGSFAGTCDVDPSEAVVNLSTPANFIENFVAKYASNGSYMFAYQFNKPYPSNSNPVFIKSDAADNIYVIRRFDGTTDFDFGPGIANFTSNATDCALSKYGPGGNHLFTTTTQGQANSYAYANSALVTPTGKVLVGGEFSRNVDFDPGAGSLLFSTAINGFGNNAWLAQYDAGTGALVSAVQNGEQFSRYTQHDLGNVVKTDAAGNIYIAGEFKDSIDADPGPGRFILHNSAPGWSNVFFAKYSSSGELIMAKRIEGSHNVYVSDMEISQSGEIYLAGFFQNITDFDPNETSFVVGATPSGSSTYSDGYFAKFSAAGDLVFVKPIRGTGTEIVRNLVTTSTNIFITVSASATMDLDPGDAGAANVASGTYLARYSPEGNYQSSVASNENLTRSTNGDLFTFSSAQTTGNISCYWPNGGLKCNIPTNFGNITGLAFDAQSNIYIAGSFEGTFDFDPTEGVYNMTTYNSVYFSSNTYIVSLNGSGQFRWAKSFDAIGFSQNAPQKIAFDGQGNLLIVGTFGHQNTTSSVDFDPGTAVYTMKAEGGNDSYMAGLNTNGDFLFAQRFAGPVTIFPQSMYAHGTNIYLCGQAPQFADLDPGPATGSFYASNGYDVFFAKYSTCALTLPSSNTGIRQDVAEGKWFTDGNCGLLAAVVPAGNAPVNGVVNAQAFVSNSPLVTGDHFLAGRFYSLTPENNATTATGTITLYVTQSEFNSLNENNSTNRLPNSPTDFGGKSNIRIIKYSGTSNNGSGLPGSYSGKRETIDPADSAIIWNAQAGRWEITFPTTGFSGFFIGNDLALKNACPGGSVQLSSGITGTTYQWQVNSGNGFTNISNSEVYNGSNNAVLIINNMPHTISDYTFRCVVDGVSYSAAYKVNAANEWTGAADTQWDNAANWSCGDVPGSNSNVFIRAGKPRYPQVLQSVSIRSLQLAPEAQISVAPGAAVNILY